MNLRGTTCCQGQKVRQLCELCVAKQHWLLAGGWRQQHEAPDVITLCCHALLQECSRYANGCSELRTVVMNLLRRGGYRSIRQGFRELAYDIKGMLALGGVQLAGTAAE